MAHHVVDIVEGEVIHVLAGDHADRLGCFAGCKHQAGRGGNGTRGVGAGTFGDSAQLVGDHLGGPQFQGIGSVAGDQHITAIALALSLQAAVGKQAVQAFLDAV